jgi:hypothetical protein
MIRTGVLPDLKAVPAEMTDTADRELSRTQKTMPVEGTVARLRFGLSRTHMAASAARPRGRNG